MSFLKRCVGMWMLAALLNGCHSGEEPTVTLSDQDYFPLRVGNYYVYNVEEVAYDQGTETPSTYEMMLKVVDSLLNPNGSYHYVVYQYTRMPADQDWTYKSTWSWYRDNLTAVATEDNISFVKLSFPIGDGKQWNGNALNTLGGEQNCHDAPCDLYQYENIGMAFSTSDTTYTDAITVNQNDNTDVIVGQNVRKEVYARKVGMIYKESYVVEYCTIGDCIGQQKIINGNKLVMQLASYVDR